MLEPKAHFSISVEALSAFRKASSVIIQETVARSLERKDELIQHGENSENLLTAGLEFTTRMLDAAMATGEIPLLEDELTWARERLPHEGVAPQHVLSRLRIYRDVVNEILAPEYAREVTQFLDWMISRQQDLI